METHHTLLSESTFTDTTCARVTGSSYPKLVVVPHISEVKLNALVNHSLLRRRGSAVEQLVYLCTWKRPNRIPAVTVK
jgi:hypothetical protein